MLMKIYVSPSTQDLNIGVKDYGTEEKRMNQLADIVCNLLKYNCFDIVRNKPEMNLNQIVADSNKNKPDVHVALHSNANNGKSRGCEVWGYLINGKETNSEKLSKAIYAELEPITPTSDRGVKNGVDTKFAEIIKVDSTSCLIEVAFHDNLDDAIWIMNNMPLIAESIVKGICKYFKQEFKKPIDINEYEIKYKALVNDLKIILNKSIQKG